MGDHRPAPQFQAQSTDPTVPTGSSQSAPGSNPPPQVSYQHQFPVHQSRPQVVGSAASPPVLPSVPFQPTGIPPSQRSMGQKPSPYPALPTTKEESKASAYHFIPPQEEEKKAEATGVSAYFRAFMEKGKNLIKSNTIPLPPDEPRTSLRARLEQCTGWVDDYEKWICPVCTLENSSEFYQCEVCMGENGAVKTILDVIGRPGKKHEKGKFENLMEYIASVGSDA